MLQVLDVLYDRLVHRQRLLVSVLELHQLVGRVAVLLRLEVFDDTRKVFSHNILLIVHFSSQNWTSLGQTSTLTEPQRVSRTGSHSPGFQLDITGASEDLQDNVVSQGSGWTDLCLEGASEGLWMVVQSFG